MLRKVGWFAAVLAVAGCSGATTSDTEVTKAQVAQGDHEGGGDVCAVEGWYGDGECDTFCSEADSDCTPVPGEPVVCAAFLEASDGQCGRPAGDPCMMQDPDCVVGDGSGVACALLIEVPDGVCSRSPEDPCRFQDQDCQDGIVCPAIELLPPSDGQCELRDDACWVDPDCSSVVCPAIALMPDGVCEERPEDPCWHDPDCDEPVGCDDYIEVSDGVCSRPPDDPCMLQDPDCGVVCPTIPLPAPDGVCEERPEDPCWFDQDCGVACALYVELPDGVCSRPADDPCISQDPDCSGVTCPELPVPPLDGVCEIRADDPCWRDPDCGVACAEYVSTPDGVCSRPADDPCIFQDPDCTGPIACAAYIEVSDGVCSRAADDPCISQDPDCVPATVCDTFAPVEPDGVCSMAPGDPCLSTDPDCVDCAPDDAQGEGACDMFLGWAWDGVSCVGLGGCSCQGTACGELHASQEDCEAARAECTAR